MPKEAYIKPKEAYIHGKRGTHTDVHTCTHGYTYMHCMYVHVDAYIHM